MLHFFNHPVCNYKKKNHITFFMRYIWADIFHDRQVYSGKRKSYS